MRTAIAVLVGGSLAVGLTFGQEPADENQPPDAATQAAILDLIGQLDEDSFKAREQAEKALIDHGRAALAALRNANTTARDPEVRSRAGRAATAILLREHKQRIEAFLDAEQPPDDALPGWVRFRDQVGVSPRPTTMFSPRAKMMFVNWQRAEPELFMALEADDDRFAELFTQRAAEISEAYRTKQPVPTANNGAALFLAGEPSLAMNDRTQEHVVDVAYAFRQRYLDGTLYERNVPVGWIMRDDTTTLEVLAARTRIAKLTLSQEGIIPARKILGSLAKNDKAFVDAMDTMLWLGTKQDLPQVEALFECGLSYFGSLEGKYRVEYRDIALAAALKMTRQRCYEYGFPRAKEDSKYISSWIDCGFHDEATREKAFARYAKWKSEQPPTTAPDE